MRLIRIAALCLMAALLSGLCACGVQESASAAPKTVLRIVHYENEGKQAWINTFNGFMEENPSIVIDYDLTGGDEYMQLLRTRFLSNESLDIIGVHPGNAEALLYAQSGYLHDLTGQPFLAGVRQDALETGMWDGRNYGLPINQSYIACLYNQEIFERYGLEVPKTWTEFLGICQFLLENGETPLAQGTKEPFVTQLIANALAVTQVYRDTPDFDKALAQGQTTFSSSRWKAVMEMFLSLSPYFSENFMSITYHQCLSDFASGKAAMTVMGTFSLQLLHAENPQLRYGAFALPASEDSNSWIPFSVGGMLAINAQSEHKEEALLFFDYLMRDDVYYRYLSECRTLPVKEGIPVDYDPALTELSTANSPTYFFVNRDWPLELSEALMRGVQEMFAGRSIDSILREMDEIEARAAKDR